jgi:hypothetical protein
MPETADKTSKKFGLLAEFDSPATLFHACEQVRDAGYTRWDAHSPFPVHGLERAMGLRPSRLPFYVLISALTGMVGAITLQWWVHAVHYPLVISGKPYFSWQAFVPVTFEATILFGAAGAVLGMLHLNRLPRHYHSLFRSRRFERVTDDRFFISVEAADPRFDPQQTRALLEQAGASGIEEIDD